MDDGVDDESRPVSAAGSERMASTKAAGYVAARAEARARPPRLGGEGSSEAAAAGDAPAPSTTPAKVGRRKPPNAPAAKRAPAGVAAAAPANPPPAGEHKPPLSKAEEARNRLRGSRNRRSASGAAALSDRPPRGGDAAGADEKSRGVPSRDAKEATIPDTAERSAAAYTASAAAAAKLADKLGSVTGIKPRASFSATDRANKAAAAAAAAQKAHVGANAAALERARVVRADFPASNEAGSTREGFTQSSGESFVHGLDEAEMVLRVGSLSSAETLADARAAVGRMRRLLSDVYAASKALRCEPQNAYGHLLHRVGQPTDRESRDVDLDGLLGREKVLDMVASTAELRNLLRVKVQDNNDLRLAATALGETAGFFARLDAEAAKRNVQPHEVLAAQRPEGGRAR